MISSIFLFMFLRSHDNYLDPLTSLRNRFAFYNDIEYLKRDVTAVASLDMNGLKKLNDTMGHGAGDEALRVIGRSLKAVSGRAMHAYRIGGDEFTLLFIRQDKTAVQDILDGVKSRITEAGYSVSVGYAIRNDRDDTVTEMLRKSDEKMYEDKAEHYRQNGNDRRGK